MSKIVFCNGKGGPGKTTLALGVSLALAYKGYDVAYQDTDSQGTFTHAFAMFERAGEPLLARLSAHTQRRPVHHTIVDAPPRLDFSERQLHEALRTAAVVCLPCAPAWADIWTTIDTLRELPKLYPNPAYVIAINKVDRRTAFSKVVRAKLEADLAAEGLAVTVLKTEVPQMAGLTDFPMFGWGELKPDGREVFTALALELKRFAEAPKVPAEAATA